jgi:beta-lactamase class A
MKIVFRALLYFSFALSAPVFGDAEAMPTNKPQMLWDKLGESIRQWDTKLDGVLGVAILDLTDHHLWTLNADQVFPTASTIKLTILAELYRQEGEARAGHPGSARLGDLYTVSQEDIVADSAVLENTTPGVTKLTNRDLAGAVVAVSDNSASNILANRVGRARVNSMLDGLGLKSTRLNRQMMDLQAAKEGRENVATPGELVTLLQDIYEHKVFNAELTEDFFKLLSTGKSSAIPVLIPEGVRIANKPGALAGVRCDAGIVFVPGRPFAIAIMTSYDRDERAAYEIISHIAHDAWKMFDVMSVSSEYGRQITERNSH